MTTTVKTRTWPITEIFGPTIQGEGVDQGQPCYFIRFGGCDYKCEWCDTPHAVLPENVRHSRRMGEHEIVAALDALPRGPRSIVLSGGNPCLHDVSTLVRRLRVLGYRLAVETQGTRFQAWLGDCFRVCVSPKPPSSGMEYTKEDLMAFLEKLMGVKTPEYFYNGGVFIKVVVFDHTDYEFAKEIYLHINEHSGGVGLPFFLSTGNDAGATVGNPSRVDQRTVEEVRNDLIDHTRWLVNRVMVDPLMEEVRVQTQFHVMLWGNERGR